MMQEQEEEENNTKEEEGTKVGVVCVNEMGGEKV
jgi:hypothetical protein